MFQIEIGQRSTKFAGGRPLRNDRGRSRRGLTVDDRQVEINSRMRIEKTNEIFTQRKIRISTGECWIDEHPRTGTLFLTVKAMRRRQTELLSSIPKETSPNPKLENLRCSEGAEPVPSIGDKSPVCIRSA